jgi:hypothetical protein
VACRLITNFTKQVQLDGVSPKGMSCVGVINYLTGCLSVSHITVANTRDIPKARFPELAGRKRRLLRAKEACEGRDNSLWVANRQIIPTTLNGDEF